MEVIIDEIQSYEDSPSELIFDDFEELIFPNHPLGRNILGNPELLRQFTSEDARKFVVHSITDRKTWYFSFKEIFPFRKSSITLEKVTSDIPQFERKQNASYRLNTNPTNWFSQGYPQAHVMIGGRGYHAYDERRTGLYLLNNILGGPWYEQPAQHLFTWKKRFGLQRRIQSDIPIRIRVHSVSISVVTCMGYRPLYFIST